MCSACAITSVNLMQVCSTPFSRLINSEAREFLGSYVIQAKFLIFFSIAVICVIVLRRLLEIMRSKKFFWLAIIITASLSGVFTWCQNFFFIQFFSQFKLSVMIIEVFWERHLFETAFAQARREVVLTRNESTILTLYLFWENLQREITCQYTDINSIRLLI